ncbi:hypothetical protein GOODEAATRI_010183, partial [Goodea atripinnis]
TNVHSSEAGYQDRLSRLESDKECLILQVSVLTDQVEVQGEKIRDLDKSLELHREKLNAAEELLQQEELQDLERHLEERDEELRRLKGETHNRIAGVERAETERKGTEHLDLAGVPPQKPHDAAPLPSSPETKKKSSGLKRSHSTSFNLDDGAETEFRRGGVRATAGPRLGWINELRFCNTWLLFNPPPQEDLLSLKVGSVLHHLSIKRAIQVLRLNSYEPNCLRRRPSDENNITPAEISQWTNHRVMEWLRSVDLAEYAPNLRGSGPRRSSFGGLGSLRRKRQDDGEDYICPMNVEMPKNSSFQRNVHIYEETLDHLEQVGVSTAELS